MKRINIFTKGIVKKSVRVPVEQLDCGIQIQGCYIFAPDLYNMFYKKLEVPVFSESREQIGTAKIQEVPGIMGIIRVNLESFSILVSKNQLFNLVCCGNISEVSALLV